MKSTFFSREILFSRITVLMISVVLIFVVEFRMKKKFLENFLKREFLSKNDEFLSENEPTLEKKFVK